MTDSNVIDRRSKKLSRTSQPSTRKSRSISRYFLGGKRHSCDLSTQDVDISHCLISNGIFDSHDLSTSVTLFRHYHTCRRLLILTSQNELLITKTNSKQSIWKIKQRLDVHRLWFSTNLQSFHDPIAAEITSLTYYDSSRSIILGWPLAENYLVEFDNVAIRDQWIDRFQRSQRRFWQQNSTKIEHVRIVIDQNQDTDSANSQSYLIRKVIGIRPQDTVKDLIQKCLDTSHLQDTAVENYILYVYNDANHPVHPNQWLPLLVMINSGSERLTKTERYPAASLFALIRTVTQRSRSLENVSDRQRKQRRRDHAGGGGERRGGEDEGHEHPYMIKKKDPQNQTQSTINSDDGQLINSTTSNLHHSTASLNQIPMNSHDFELRKRDFSSNEHLSKRLRFFHRRRAKDVLLKSPVQPTSFNDETHSTKSHRQFFGETLDDLIKRYDQQLPPVIQQLLEILYYKGPETTGIFRKVANNRSVKESIDKIERNIPLQEDDLHPILAAGIFKHFLRTLPSPIFNANEYDQWKKCLRLSSLKEKLVFARTNIIGSLSSSNHLLLKGFICVLYRISQNAETNGMNPFNLGLCVSNSLFKTESTSITSGKQEADVMSSIVEFLIVNCSLLFGNDVTTCIPEKHLFIQQNRIYPNASSIESLDEVESSPHLPVVNRSRDSGLATSDQPFNDDSSEVSEHFRRQPTTPDWTTAISYGKGTVLTSIFVPTNRGRTIKNIYKPSKQFLEREKLTIDTTDDSDHDRTGDSSVRSSSTTVNNVTTTKIKRSKPISRHSSLGSTEYHYQQQQPQQNSFNESKRPLSHHDVKRTSSLKQFHHSSDEGDVGDEQTTMKKKSNSILLKKTESTTMTPTKTNTIERRGRLTKSKSNGINRTTEEESMTTRSLIPDSQDLDLLNEPLSSINQRFLNPSSSRSASFTIIPTSIPNGQKKLDSPSMGPMDFHYRHVSNASDGRSRHNGPLAATTNQIYQVPRTFVHQSDSRQIPLSNAVQMKPADDVLLSHNRCRPCHRQNALRYKSVDQDNSSSTDGQTTLIRYPSMERRSTPPAAAAAAVAATSRKSASFDIHDELRPSDISWSVKEKAKIFEHHQPRETRQFSTGRENYV